MNVLAWVESTVVATQAWAQRHPAWAIVAVLAFAAFVFGLAKLLAWADSDMAPAQPIENLPDVEGAALGNDGRYHAVTAGYVGGGRYGWECLCNAGSHEWGHDSLDGATHVATIHLFESGALVEAY